MSDERITVTCPGCAARLRLPAKAAGRRVRCPKCAEAISVEAPAEAEPVGAAVGAGLLDDDFAGLAQGAATESAETQQARFAAKAAQAARAVPMAGGPDLDIEATPGRRMNWGAFGVGLGHALVPFSWVNRIRLAMLILGGVLVWLGTKELELRGRSRVEAQVISCADLEARGPGDNLHIKLTDFQLLPKYAYEVKGTRWRGAWAPAVPARVVAEAIARELKVELSALKSLSDEQIKRAEAKLEDMDFEFKIIASFPKADGEEFMERMYAADDLEGMLMVDGYLTTLDKETKELLHGRYPLAKLNKCWVLVVGRERKTQLAARGEQLGGIGLVLAGLVSAAFHARGQAT